ncbi:MAG TPA: hypothetical protein VG937_07680 [Polyangiaceae bacterium]|nr:hypothetical protein [Polyangiaceae bacterium]
MEEKPSKVPQVTWGFWLIKILATTLGETGGDAVTMTLNLGYLVGTAIFGAIVVFAVAFQLFAKRFNTALYWTVIVATTTVGTTLADFVDRSLGVGYLGGSLILFGLVLASLLAWFMSCGSVAVGRVSTAKAELFYWITILFSQTLGTALGDWIADDTGLGYAGGALVFATGLAVVFALYKLAHVSRTLLFWAAFIFTRPLGATVGDFLDKPRAQGGLEFGRFTASAVLVVAMVLCILLIPQRAARQAASAD